MIMPNDLCIFYKKQYKYRHGLHPQELWYGYLTLLVDVWKLAHIEWIRWTILFGPPFLHKYCHKRYIHNDLVIQRAKQWNVLGQSSNRNMKSTPLLQNLSFNNLLLSMKSASLRSGSARLLNSKPMKLELSLYGTDIFYHFDHGDRHMSSWRIRLTLLVSFINWNRCVICCQGHLKNMATQINSIAAGKNYTR